MQQLISPENEARITDCRAAYGSWLRSERAIALAVCLGIMMLAAAVVRGDGPPPAPTGVCCLGGGMAPIFDITEADCRLQADPGSTLPWIEGDFDPTTDKTPCDMLPGGD